MDFEFRIIGCISNMLVGGKSLIWSQFTNIVKSENNCELLNCKIPVIDCIS